MQRISEFEDYSTPRGRIKLILSRIKWPHIVAAVIVCALVGIVIAASVTSSTPEQSSNAEQNANTDQNLNAEPTEPLLTATATKSQIKGEKNKNFNQGRSRDIQPTQSLTSTPTSTLSPLLTTSSPPPSVPPTSVATNDKLPKENPTVDNSANKNNAGGYHIDFQGDVENFVFLGLNQPWWDVSTVPVHLRVRNAVLNATEFIHSLKGTRKLTSIDLELQGVLGNFTPVHLPDLSDFTYNYVGPYDHSAGAWYQQPEKLKSLLFFEKTENGTTDDSETWDITRDLTNLGVNISVMIRGTRLVHINRAEGLIVLNVDYGWEIIENTKGDYSHLVLVSCPRAVSPSSPVVTLSSQLKYLNLYNITRPLDINYTMVPVKFGQLLQSASQLETLIAYHSAIGTGFKIPLNLQDLPPTLKRISVRGISLELTSSSFVSSVEDLTLAEGELTPNIIDNFQSIFSKVKRFQLFLGNETIRESEKEKDNVNVPNNANQVVTTSTTKIIDLLPKALKMNSVERILVTDFDWTVAMEMENEGLVQSLQSFGLPSGIENFVLTKVGKGESEKEGNTFSATIVTDENVLREKYDTFGFEDIETFEHYRSLL